MKGQAPFGWDIRDSRPREQQVIHLMRQLRSGGESLNGTACELN